MPLATTLEKVWSALHFFSFFLGGSLFTIGSVALIVPFTDSDGSYGRGLTAYTSALLVGWSYTIGSLGFLAVDAMEEWWMCTQVALPKLKSSESSSLLGKTKEIDNNVNNETSHFGSSSLEDENNYNQEEVKAERKAIILLRINIMLSFIGSSAYLIGSIAFIPQVASKPYGPFLGNWGFIVGSAFIFVSQCWKIHRACTTPDESLESLEDTDAEALAVRYSFLSQLTRVGIEVGACFGGLSFLIGTAIYAATAAGSTPSDDALDIWVFGSLAFTFGSLCVFCRHFIFGLV